MSKSLKLVNGDLAVSGRSFTTVRGKEKLIQDLRNWILERVGTDPATPTFGSNLDSFIGSTLVADRAQTIHAEILALLTRYQQLQLEKMQNEAVLYQGQTTLDPDEVIDSIEGVETKLFDATTIVVRVFLTTLAGATVGLTFPVEN